MGLFIIDTPDVIEQVAELLYTSPDLVLGFNTFLPAGFHISLTDDNRYVFTSPKSQPRVLPCPEGHSGAVAPNDGGADTPGDDESGMEEDDDSREDDKESADAEESDEEDVEDGELLFEEVVRSEDHIEFLEDKD
uniref:Uncharacterized protein n=1 Tax=Caenorhabditis japonica TaxID=281687 RepID=A0A8R1IP04_CAEJA